MRRKEKEITAISDLESVIRKSRVCRLGIQDKDMPYIVPVCFGYQENTLYFHSALEGRKIDLLKQNPRVCFELDILVKINPHDTACEWGMKYQSIIGRGVTLFIEEADEKKAALDIIMAQYSKKIYSYDRTLLEKTAVFKVNIEQMTGKQSL